MLINVVFTVALAAGVALVAMSLLTLAVPRFQFWPPPSAASWQHTTLRVVFRLFVIGLIVLSVLTYNSQASVWRHLIGVPLLATGFGFALHWTNFLGWRNAFGEARGLKTDGPYRWSRNPIYVVTFVGLIGWSIIVAAPEVTGLLLFWAGFYTLAPFVEEPWLERKYGDAFRTYKSRVPRFLAVSSRL